MTRHATIPTTARARRAAIGLMALGLLLSGCSAGPAVEVPTATATSTPTADPRAVAAAIGATFPTEAEWLENYERGSLCTAQVAGPTDCGNNVGVPGTNSSGSTLREGVSAVTARFVSLGIIDWGSTDAAQASLDGSEADGLVYNGDFDIPIDLQANTTGERGSGTLVEFERDGWSGYKLSRLSEMTGQNAVGPMSSNVLIVLTNGEFEFTLRLEQASAEPGIADAEVSGWLDRSFASGTGQEDGS